MLQTAPDKHSRKIAPGNEGVTNRRKKIPGKILISLNETHLSEFLRQKIVSVAGMCCVRDA